MAVPEFDVFIAHASEDKDYVNALVIALETSSIRVWFDARSLSWGEDLRPSIDRGLASCRYGLVVLSQAFLRKKKWTEYELNALFAREQLGSPVVLPIWHGVTRDQLLAYSPALADRFAKSSAHDTPSDIAATLLGMLGRAAVEAVPSPTRAAAEAAAGQSGPEELERLNALGDFYRDAKSNPVEALVWYRKAADRGFAAAQTNIAYLYCVGQGVPRDYGEAMKWLRRAAEQGFAPALFNIGNLYREGLGVEKDPTQALAWWRRAAEAGDTDAQQNLGTAYRQGLGVPRDDEQAMAWFHRALEAGDAGAFDKIRELRRQLAREHAFRNAADGAVSPAAMSLLGDSLSDMLAFHNAGDWGNLSLEQELRNLRALRSGGPLQSEYVLRSGEVLQIQTDAERRAFFVGVKGEEEGVSFPG